MALFTHPPASCLRSAGVPVLGSEAVCSAPHCSRRKPSARFARISLFFFSNGHRAETTSHLRGSGSAAHTGPGKPRLLPAHRAGSTVCAGDTFFKKLFFPDGQCVDPEGRERERDGGVRKSRYPPDYGARLHVAAALLLSVRAARFVAETRFHFEAFCVLTQQCVVSDEPACSVL